MSWSKIWDQPVKNAAVGGGGFVFAVHENTGNIHKWNPPGSSQFIEEGPWLKIGGPGADFVIVQYTFLVGLAPDHSGVYLYQPIFLDKTKHKWAKIGGPMDSIYGGGDGLLATSPGSKNVNQYRGSLSGAAEAWKKIGGPGKMFAVGDTNTDFKVHLFGISPKGGVYLCEGKPKNDELEWTFIGGPSGKIYAGGEYLYGTEPGPKPGTEKDVFLWQKDQKWVQIQKGVFNMCTIDAQGAFYALDSKGVWRFDGFQWDPNPIGGPAAGIFAGGAGDLVATSPVKHNLWRYTP